MPVIKKITGLRIMALLFPMILVTACRTDPYGTDTGSLLASGRGSAAGISSPGAGSSAQSAFSSSLNRLEASSAPGKPQARSAPRTTSNSAITLQATVSDTSQTSHPSAGVSKTVLIIGDSNTENGYITNGLQDIMDATYGYTGNGYYPLNDNFPIPLRGGVKVVNDLFWTPYDMVTWQGALGIPSNAPDGIWVSSATPDSVTTVSFRGDAVNVYYLVQPNGGQFSIEIDGKAVKLVSTAAPDRLSKKTSVQGLSAGMHSMRLIVKDGTTTLQGFEVLNGASRTVVHNWGNASASTSDFLAIDKQVFVSGLSALKPDVVVILLGTNDNFLNKLSAAQFQTNLFSLGGRVKEAVPNGKILLVSTFDTNTPDTISLLHEYVRVAYPGAQSATGCSYWDMNTWFGPYNSANMADDYHCNADAGQRIAAELWRQLQLL